MNLALLPTPEWDHKGWEADFPNLAVIIELYETYRVKPLFFAFERLDYPD